MPQSKKPTFIEHFSNIDDPRTRHSNHNLGDIFFIALCAVISGCDSWVAIEAYGKMKQSWLEEYLSLENGIPSHDTFGRVFSLIEPAQFQKCFSSWIQTVIKHVLGDVISIDGKCLRGSYDKADNKAAIHMVSAWSSAHQLVLGQVKVDEKSNEITALPSLLQNLTVKGAIITADAMHTQKKTAKLVVEKGADYLLALKGNQSTLHDDVVLFFEKIPSKDSHSLGYHKTTGAGHGRIEEREIWVCNQIDWLKERHNFPHLSSIIKVTSNRHKNEKETKESRYFISSICHNDASLFGRYVRDHWGVENGLHWRLDMAFDEDHCRIRKGHADENMAMLRHMSLNLLKEEKTKKVGMKIKRQMAGWDSNYLLKVMQEI